jgi:hypothetical protein
MCIVYKILYVTVLYYKATRYLKRTIEARSFKHCCNGKILSVKYSKCVFVAYVIQHVSTCAIIGMRDLSGSIFFSILSLTGMLFDIKFLNIKCVF